MDNKGKLHEWNTKRKCVDRYISMSDTVLASILTKCQDDPTHDISLALHDQVQVSGIASGVNSKKERAEVIPYDLAKRWNIGLETAKRTLLKTTQMGLRTSQILCCLNDIVKMIECSGTGDFLLICFLTLLRQGLVHTGEQICPSLCPQEHMM